MPAPRRGTPAGEPGRARCVELEAGGVCSLDPRVLTMAVFVCLCVFAYVCVWLCGCVFGNPLVPLPQPDKKFEFPKDAFQSFRAPFSARAILGAAAFVVRGTAQAVRPSSAAIALLAHLDRLAMEYVSIVESSPANGSASDRAAYAACVGAPPISVAPALPVFMLLHSLLHQLESEFLRPFYAGMAHGPTLASSNVPATISPPEAKAAAQAVAVAEAAKRRVLMGACASLSCLRILHANLLMIKVKDIPYVPLHFPLSAHLQPPDERAPVCVHQARRGRPVSHDTRQRRVLRGTTRSRAPAEVPAAPRAGIG